MAIKVLDKALANQIAAGEVIERPASVVKELVENSLDAKAQKIIVDIKQGGHELIKIIDNGEGILKEDLPLALARHATSKISKLADLETIQSLGFRGEALASIAAVSQLTLYSHHHQEDLAWRITQENIDFLEPCAHPFGTTIEVKNLFYNTPARRKFLRQPKTEFLQIEILLHKLALSHFDVAFELIHNQRTIFSFPAAHTQETMTKRVTAILGQEFINQAVLINYARTGFTLKGWLASPNFNRSQPDMQYWFLNQRCVKDKTLAYAARHAYEEVLYNQRHPAYVLYLQCDPKEVDVNVHPTKQEVRFCDNRSMSQFVIHGIKTALRDGGSQGGESRLSPFIPSLGFPEAQDMVRKRFTLYSAGVAAKPIFSRPEKPHPAAVHEQLEVFDYLTTLIDKPQSPENVLFSKLALGTALAQLKNTFILAQNEQGLVIVDIHAAHERLEYEKMKTKGDHYQLIRQPLLIPINITLNPQEYKLWETYQDQFTAAGIVTSALNEQTIMIREMPALFIKVNLSQLMHDLLSDLAVLPTSQKIPELWHELLGNIACKNALKTNEKLSLAEMNALLRDMENTPNSGQCNHGRPTWKQITWLELDRFFLRGR